MKIGRLFGYCFWIPACFTAGVVFIYFHNDPLFVTITLGTGLIGFAIGLSITFYFDIKSRLEKNENYFNSKIL